MIRRIIEEHRVERVKVLLVPYIIVKDDVYLLMLLDRQYEEWTFMSGGCKYSDGHPDNCVYRESMEELKGILDKRLLEGKMETMEYRTEMKAGGKSLRVLYYIYFVQIHGDLKLADEVRQEFRHRRPRNASEDENLELEFVPLRNIKRRKLWDFIVELINNENFTARLKPRPRDMQVDVYQTLHRY